MKIVFLDSATVGDLPNIEKFKTFGEYIAYDYTCKEDRIERIADADVVITNKVVIDEDVINSCPNLKLICVAATGTNNIDLKYAEKRGVLVKNVAGYSTDSVVQITYSILFELLSHTSYFNRYVQSGQYSCSPSFTLINPAFNELRNKKFGVVGLGAIGRKVATIAEAFGAKVVYYSTSGANSTNDYQRVEMDELLAECDIISIHAPLNENTNNLFDYDKFCKMKNTAYIINVGRGGIINENDLVKALDQNQIAGAGLDVFSVEPMLNDSSILQLNFKHKLVATPHIAWASVEARTLLVDKIIENIENTKF